jgi:transcriptional regulator with XRE-family HTH domain
MTVAIFGYIGGEKTEMNRIKELREAKHITQVELAANALISQPYLHDLENNRRGAKEETLQRIADALGVPVEELTEKAG